MAVKVKTDKELIKQFLERGVDKIYPSKEALEKKLLSGERLRVYQGFDPTGPYLHVGHAMGIRALRLLQQLGHEVIFLVGDFTAKIGDPDKGKTRQILTDEEIAENMEGWKKQAERFIEFEGENPVRFELNSRWLSKLNLEELIKLMSNITVQRLLERDLFEKRIKEGLPLKLHETLYPLLQGYDGVVLEVDMEVAGADQLFNMLVGRDLSMTYLEKERFVRTNKMMNAPDGITMSKTKGNGINLSDNARDIYGKVMSYGDESILAGFELLTDVPIGEIEQMKAAMEGGSNPMDFKKKLAFELAKQIRGEKEAEEAAKEFKEVFSKRKAPEKMPTVKAEEGESWFSVLKKCVGGSMSGSEIKRLAIQGAIKADQVLLRDLEEKVVPKSKGIIVKIGKKSWYKVVK